MADVKDGTAHLDINCRADLFLVAAGHDKLDYIYMKQRYFK